PTRRASGSPCAGSRSAARRRSWSAASPPPRPRRPPTIRRRRAPPSPSAPSARGRSPPRRRPTWRAPRGAASRPAPRQARAPAAERAGLGFLSRLLAHELGTSHGLMMRLTGSAHGALDHATEAAAEPVAALRLSAIVARLGDRFRRGLLTLCGLAAGPGGNPRKVAGMVWGGPEPVPANAPALPAPAGHGVHRSNLRLACSNPVVAGAVAADQGNGLAAYAPAGHGVHRSNAGFMRRAAGAR